MVGGNLMRWANLLAESENTAGLMDLIMRS